MQRMLITGCIVLAMAGTALADPEVLDTRMTNAVSYNGAPPDTIGFAAFGFADLIALPTGNGPVAQLWFTAAGPGGLSIDSSFFLPNNPFKMVGKSDFGRQEDILPMFTAPAVVPVSTTAAPELVVVDDKNPGFVLRFHGFGVDVVPVGVS